MCEEIAKDIMRIAGKEVALLSHYTKTKSQIKPWLRMNMSLKYKSILRTYFFKFCIKLMCLGEVVKKQIREIGCLSTPVQYKQSGQLPFPIFIDLF